MWHFSSESVGHALSRPTALRVRSHISYSRTKFPANWWRTRDNPFCIPSLRMDENSNISTENLYGLLWADIDIWSCGISTGGLNRFSFSYWIRPNPDFLIGEDSVVVDSVLSRSFHSLVELGRTYFNRWFEQVFILLLN